MSREMENSGIDWVGMIPNNWKTVRIKNVLNERSEKNSPIKSNVILSLMRDEGVILYDEKGDVGNRAKEDLSKYKLAFKEDIVMNSMNVIIGSVNKSPYDGVVSPVYHVLYPKNNSYDVDYINYLFQTTEFQESLKGIGNGILAHRMRIPMNKLNNVVLPIPELYVQKTIVDHLNETTSLINNIIQETKYSMEELKKYKQSIITEAVTKGIEPNVKMKDSGIEVIGKVNSNYSIIPLGYLGSLQNGISKSGDYFGEGYPFVSYGDVYKNRVLPFSVKGLIRSTKEEQEQYSVRKGDIFFTRTSEIIEEVGMASVCLNNIEQATFAGFLIRFRPNENNQLLSKYARYYLEATFIRDFFAKEMNLVTRASLSQPLLKKLPIILPSVNEQQKIVSYLDTQSNRIDALISDKEKVIKELEQYKKSLIYEYVTGKKEV
ncbi:restriction endonuclease subunit S [Priestia sp. FSL W8-0001]|uniref:restriction endonuclease subunit S n=1 Tax=unclassified Priestia TaxID=2800374 RepID=UPI0030F7F137